MLASGQRVGRRLLRRATLRTTLRVSSIGLPIVTVAVVGLVLWLAPRPVTPADRIEHLPANLFERPPLDAEITVSTPAEAAQRRLRLRRFVFGRDGLPAGQPVVETGITDVLFAAGLSNLERIDRLTVRLPLGFTSVAYHLVPRQANRRLLVYHLGHHENLFRGRGAVARFLERGYAILVFAMPFAGLNRNPERVDTRCGRVVLAYAGDATVHEPLACLARPLRYFLEPVVVGLNYTSTLGYERTAMAGFSGGGWTTVLVAALDPRVQRSYPVAGSSPFHVTARSCPGATAESVPECYGDFEQRWPALYRIANYLELYVLGGWGTGRKQIAINNVYDDCCFYGTAYQEWRPRVQATLEGLGSGSYAVIGDATHRGHRLSPFALRLIERHLDSD